MKNNFKRNLYLSSAISLVVLTVSSLASFISIRSLLNSNNLVNHTQEVIYNLNEGTNKIIESQTAMRGFLITGREDFLNHFDQSEEEAHAAFDKVQQLTVDNPVQQRSLMELKPVRTKLFQFLRYRISEKRVGKNIQSYDLDTGKILMDEIRITTKRIEKHEQNLLVSRNATAKRFGNYSVILIVVAFFVSILISVLMLFRILKDFKQRSELQQILEHKDYETAQRINAISNIASQLAQGNYAIRVDDNQSDALGSVGISLNNMGKSLGKSFESLSEKEWMQTGIAQLNNTMLDEKKMSVLTKDILEFVALYVNSSAGALYVSEGDTLYYTAGYSYIAPKNKQQLKLGEGITGQAAISGKLIQIASLEEHDIKICYSLGQIKPSHVIALPLQDSKIEGVLELTSIPGFTKLELEFLTTVARNIAIAIKATKSRKKLNELLEETQSQSEELRLQHSEMEAINAELETQTEKLQASEEELRVQQEELQQTNEELAERSVLLEEKNAEIQKKSQDLELTTRYKSEFLANMSHELRTPLNSILLLSRLLSENNDKNLNHEQVEFAKVIQSSGNGLLELIDEILDLSKIEAGKMDLDLEEVIVNEITDNLNNLFYEIARDKKIQFEIITHPDAPLVIQTDRMRLEQILKNLIANAIKFTAQGSVILETKKDPNNPQMVHFAIKDTGIGISVEKQPLIFEAFQQEDGSTKRKYGGTGLGLSISRELAKLLQGEITLESKIGQGSIFTLMLPIIGSAVDRILEQDKAPLELPIPTSAALAPPENKYLSNTIPEEIPDDRSHITAHDKVILIVEDDTNFAKSLLSFSRARGYKAVVAVRGDRALEYALLYHPVGILLDIQLPVKNGWQVMEELKSNWKTKHIPVHIMSSHQLKQESLLKGAVNFLNKPIAFEKMPDIFKHIEQIINKESQKVLILEDNAKHAEALSYFLETYQIKSEIKSDVADSIHALSNKEVNCVILDMGIPDAKSYEILEKVKNDHGLEHVPVIVFTGKSLSMKEELKIKKYADSIVVKTAHSYQRMLDEVSLFLHLVEENKDEKSKKEVYKKKHLLSNLLQDKTVLVVDDDVRNIYSLTKALEVFKMQVISAIDGKEALKALDENPQIAIVLLDMMMPNMDGYQTARIIRENKKLTHLPVIAVTAKAMTGDREKCIQAGASDYITKPVDVDQLVSLLRVWLYDNF